MDSKKVVIIGAGQDASYMAEYLIENTSHMIVIAVRRSSRDNLENLSQVIGNTRVRIVTADLTDANSITSLVKDEKPDYLLNLGGSTFVPDSFNSPAHVLQVNAVSLVYILEAVRQFVSHCRVFSAGSSTEADCKSVYAVSKITAGALCKVYREKYGLYVVHGIMYNHCSPRQSEVFLPRKVAKGVARIAQAIKADKSFEPIELGNLDAQIDVSWSADFVDGIWRMMNQDNDLFVIKRVVTERFGDLGMLSRQMEQPQMSDRIRDYTLCSGELRTVRELVEKAFAAADLIKIQSDQGPQGNQQVQLRWRGEGTSEVYELGGMHTCVSKSGWDSSWGYWKTLVKINPAFYRPLDVIFAPCDSSATRRELGWEPKMSFDQIIQEMVRADMSALD